MIEWLLYRVLLVALGWYIFWYLVYLFTGFHVCTFGISNGFKLNGITYEINHGRVKIGSIRYRGWGKLGLIIVEDVEVVYKSGEKRRRKKEDGGTCPEDAEDRPISIYPKNKLACKLIHYFISHIPSLSFEFRQANLLIDKVSLDIQYTRFAVQSKTKDTNSIKFTGDFIINNLSSSLGINLTNLKINSTFLIDLKSGNVSKITLKCFTDEFHLSVFQLVKKLFLQNVDVNGLGLINGEEMGDDGSESSEESSVDFKDNQEVSDSDESSKNVNSFDDTNSTDPDHTIADLSELGKSLKFDTNTHGYETAPQEIESHQANTHESIESMNNNLENGSSNVHKRKCSNLKNVNQHIDLEDDKLDNELIKPNHGPPGYFDNIESSKNTKKPFSLFNWLWGKKQPAASRRPSTPAPTGSSSTDKFLKLVKLHNRLYTLVDTLSLHLENTVIKEIPFITIKQTQSVTVNQYFQDDSPASYLNLKITSFSFNISKMNTQNSGFNMLFDAADQPFHLTSNLQLLTVDYIIKDHANDIDQEILNIPNFAITFKSNVGYNLSQGHGFKNSVVELFASTSSPIIDLDTTQFSELCFNMILIMKYQYLKKSLNKNKESTKSNNSFDIIKNNFMDLLKENYPKLDTRIIVEQPRILIHHETSPAIFNLSYDLLDFQIFTTKNWQYHSKCIVINPKNSIYEHTVPRYKIFDAKSVTFNFNLLTDLKVKANLILDTATMNLAELSTLSLVNDLLADMKQRAHELQDIGIKNILFNSIVDEYLQKLPTKTSQPAKNDSYKFFKHLPSWFLSFEIGINSFDLFLGSRSILIPKKNLFDTEGPELKDFRGENRELRNVKVSYDQLSIIFANNIDEGAGTCPVNRGYSSEELLPQTLSSLETLNEEIVDSFWKVTTKVSNFNISTRTSLSEAGKHELFLALPATNINISSLKTKKLKIDFNVEELIVNYDRFKLFILVGSFHVMNHIIISPIKTVIQKFRDEHAIGNAKVKMNDTNKPGILDILHVDFVMNKVNLLLKIGNEFTLKIQLKQMISIINEDKGNLSIEATRLLTESPVLKNQWTRLVYIDSLNLETNLKNLSQPALYVTTNLIIFFHPHLFVAYKLFDNLSVTIKTIKYFAQVISHHDELDKVSQEIFPKVLKPLKLPDINIKSKQLSFRMEDDVFESQLNMIYQLGLVEQRKRLELMSLFELKLASDALEDAVPEDIDSKLFNLRENMSRSWIRKVKLYKIKLQNEIVRNKKYLFGNESTLDPQWNENVTPYSIYAPLLMVQMDCLDLHLSKPEFDLQGLPQYLHKIGQGIPEDMKYSMLIPTFIKLKLSELRMHLRDYPLPFVHVPKPNKEEAGVIIKGNFVLGEQFCDDNEQVRHLHVPFVPGKAESIETKYYSLELYKSLSTVKIFTDLKINFNTEYPSRFVIGCSYQFAIQQVMLNFDQFSKPPVDPSPKVGVWDKLRLIMHGNFVIKVKKNLEVAFKGSRDPYNLFTTSSGFVLSFMDNIVWTINENDDSRDFINVTSDKVSWYMPNYLASPLPCWTRDTAKSVYLPSSTSFITTCFGYYLDEGVDTKTSLGNESLSLDIVDRVVIQLSGGVHFKVGFLLQRKNDLGEPCNDSIPHYKVKLFDPEYTREGHDSYSGFRSEYISMLISLKANKDTNYNTIHLNTSTFKVIFEWWRLFDSNMMLPIRKSKMFGETSASPKFSKHLLNNIFEFHIKSLFVAHTFRDDTFEVSDKDVVECYRIRGKMEEFIADIHQKREPTKLRQDGLSKVKQVNKMAFHVGEIHLAGIDLRVINAHFNQDVYGNYTEKRSKQEFETFDNDKKWFDINDYGESGAPSLSDTPGKICIYPLLYSQKFSYIRDTNSDNEKDGALEILGTSDSVHDCTIHSKNEFIPQVGLIKDRINQLKEKLDTNISSPVVKEQLTNDINDRIDALSSDLAKLEKSASRTEEKLKEDSKMSIKENFNNKFTLISTLIKWNVNSRNTTLRYINHLHLSGVLKNVVSYESIAVVEDMIKNRTMEDDISSISTSFVTKRRGSKFKDTAEYHTSKDRLDNFDSVLRNIRDFESISEDYLIEIINPQIQLQSEEDKNSVIIVAAPSIDSKIISVYDKSDHEQYANSKVLENRYGWLIQDASIFVLTKNLSADKSGLIIIDKAYGSQTNWPPFLGVEVCRNGRLAGRHRLLVEKFAIMVTYDQVRSPLGLVASQDDSDEFMNGNQKNGNSTLDIPSNRLHIDMPQLIITSTSEQYFALYEIILGLLFYSEPTSKSEKDQLEKLRFSIDFHDLRLLKDRLEVLISYYGTLNLLARNYHFRLNSLNNEDLNNYILIKSETTKTLNEIYLLMMSIMKGENYAEGSSSNLQDNWFIRADEVTLHLLEDDRSPLIDVSLTNGRYKRSVYEDGSNKNKIEIEMMEVFNMLEYTKYSQTLGPYREIVNPDVDLLIAVNWTLNRTVGGIKIIENLEVFLEPLTVQLDEEIVNKLLKFTLQADLDNLQDISLPKKDTEGDDDAGTTDVYKNDGASGSQISVAYTSKKSGSSGSEDIKNIHEDDVSQMISRSKRYVSIVQLHLYPFILNISVDLNKGYKRMLNVQDFLVEIDPILVSNETLSVMEFGDIVKSAIIKTLLAHTGKLIKNKFLVKKRRSQKFVNQITPFKSTSTIKQSKLNHRASKQTI